MATVTLLEVLAIFGTLYYFFFLLGKENQNPFSSETKFCGQTERTNVKREETNADRGKRTKGKKYFIFKTSHTTYKLTA